MSNDRNKVSGQPFYKVHRPNLADLFEVTGSKKAAVIATIIRKVNPNSNELNLSIEEISTISKVNNKTVGETLKMLEENDFITRKYNSLMINPVVFHYGRESKQNYLLLIYRDKKRSKKKKQILVIDK